MLNVLFSSTFLVSTYHIVEVLPLQSSEYYSRRGDATSAKTKTGETMSFVNKTSQICKVCYLLLVFITEGKGFKSLCSWVICSYFYASALDIHHIKQNA